MTEEDRVFTALKTTLEKSEVSTLCRGGACSGRGRCRPARGCFFPNSREGEGRSPRQNCDQVSAGAKPPEGEKNNVYPAISKFFNKFCGFFF